MHKVRKNSLSPCYSTNNKENVQIQNIQNPTGISFKNLEQARKKKTLDYEKEKKTINTNRTPPGHYQFFMKPSYTPTQCEDRQRQSKRDGEKSIDDFRSSLKSKQKQMSSLQSQVNTLNSTISLLKDQLKNLKNQNKALYQQNAQNKRILKEKNQIIQKIKKQTPNQTQKNSISTFLPTSSNTNNYSSIKLGNGMITDYDQVNEKLNQLQEIQDRLIQQNEELKKKNQLNTAMMKNMKVLLRNGHTEQILDLLNVLDQEDNEQKNAPIEPKKSITNNLLKQSHQQKNNSGRQSLFQQKIRNQPNNIDIDEYFDHQNSSQQQQIYDEEIFFQRNTGKLKKSRAKGYYGNQRI